MNLSVTHLSKYKDLYRINPRTYEQSHTPTGVQEGGGKGVGETPLGFALHHTQDEVHIIGFRAAGGL